MCVKIINFREKNFKNVSHNFQRVNEDLFIQKRERKQEISSGKEKMIQEVLLLLTVFAKY